MTAKHRKQMTVSMGKQIFLVAKTVNVGCFNDEEQKDIAMKIMAISTTSEIDNLIAILAMTDITSSKYLIDHPDKYQKIIDAFDDVEYEDGDIKVVFTYINEGLSGEYGESEDDIPCLRFDIYEKSYLDNGDGIEHPDWDWMEVDSGSYCTTVSIETPKEIVENMAKHILDEVRDYIDGARSIRWVAAGLSHISEQTVKGM
jgi:hypothetical protein